MKKIGVLMVLAIAMLSVLAMSQDYGLAGNGGVDILGTGIFETDGAAFRFPSMQDTNIDSLIVGNDRALAIGPGIDPIATNNLEIKKNQDSGKCNRIIDNVSPCQDCCFKVNIDQIKVGNREAMAFGLSEATNNVKIVANQQ
jgi:hypothetical protein